MADQRCSALDGLTAQPTPPIETRLDQPLREYWLERVALHFRDTYAGIPMSKFPEDLRVYEHLLWECRPDTVIEIGVQNGASELWFRDRLRTLAVYGRANSARVVGVDLDVSAARRNLDEADPGWRRDIVLIEGDITDPGTANLVEEQIAPEARCLIVEDSAHEYETTVAALTSLAHLVPPGGFFIVEDGCVDVEDMRLSDDWPRGVQRGTDEWLRSELGKEFSRRRDLEVYGLTCHPGGYLQRRPETGDRS